MHDFRSFQRLVDWNLSMAGQISQLGDKYFDWVNKPVDRKMILFANPILESFTKVGRWQQAIGVRLIMVYLLFQTPWYLPLVFWIPIVTLLIMTESALAPVSMTKRAMRIFFLLNPQLVLD